MWRQNVFGINVAFLKENLFSRLLTPIFTGNILKLKKEISLYWRKYVTSQKILYCSNFHRLFQCRLDYSKKFPSALYFSCLFITHFFLFVYNAFFLAFFRIPQQFQIKLLCDLNPKLAPLTTPFFMFKISYLNNSFGGRVQGGAWWMRLFLGILSG